MAENGTEGAQDQKKDDNNCRMYEKKYPDQDENVLVTVRSVAEMGA